MSTIDIAEIRRLSVDERIQLLEEIWKSFATDTEPLPPTPAQMSEIERRVEAIRRDPSRLIPADEVFARLERDFG
jgi:putative addiction module component (TIGR02574 family)